MTDLRATLGGLGLLLSSLPFSAALLGASLLLACGSDSSPATSDELGPPGELIEVDAGSIPLGEHMSLGGAGGIPASGGRGGEGNISGVANTGGMRSGGGSSGSGSSGSGGNDGSGSDKHGLSSPCSNDSECTNPLTCHQSPVDYIANQQCGMYCDGDEMCTAAFGKNSLCIGARTCVKTCTSDLNCPDRTHCNEYGWCERGGPGSGVPYCAGSATPCSALSSLACITASGCKDNSSCSGSPPSCYSQFDVYSCGGIDGCIWSSYSKTCSGSAHSCSTYYGQASCGFQRGCIWTGGCYGTPTPCSKQFVSLCDEQPGCSRITD